MRTVIEEYKVYDIAELKKVDELSYRTALENLSRQWANDIMEFDWYDFKDSLTAFLSVFNLKITDYSVSLYDHSYIYTNANDYREKHSNAEINEHVKELNEMIKKADCIDITGVWSDYIVMRYFENTDIKEVTYNDIHKHLDNIAQWSLSEFKKLSEENISTEKWLIDYAQNQDLEFDENGEKYF